MIHGLLDQYKALTAICYHTDYSDKSSVKKHNQSVRKMNDIADVIEKGETVESPEDFARLLDISEHGTKIWAAIHLMERMTITIQTKEKALAVITEAAQGKNAEAAGYRIWLKNWYEKESSEHG